MSEYIKISEYQPRAIRLTDADYAELQRRGMAAFREWLRRPTN